MKLSIVTTLYNSAAYIHELKLGCGDVREIEIVGDTEAAKENWHFEGPFRKMTFASRMQHKIYWGPLKKPIEWSLKTIIAPWAYVASVLYHDFFWYPANRKRVEEALQSSWGRLFANWEKLQLPPDDLSSEGWEDVGKWEIEPYIKSLKESRVHFEQALKILGECIKEAPEFSLKRRLIKK